MTPDRIERERAGAVPSRRDRIESALRSRPRDGDQTEDAARRIAASVQELQAGPSDSLRRRVVEDIA